MFGNDIIEFYCDDRFYGALPEPKEASKCIPEWFKKIKPFEGRHREGFAEPTAKKCLPLLDSMSLGYILPLQGDLHVTANHDLSIIRCGERNREALMVQDGHPSVQVHSSAWPVQKQDPIKFINQWRIKTKPGWSCLFTMPMNHIGMPFTTLSGVVDTDKYHQPVNFPAIWNVPNYDDTLKAGTPIVQIIPFKREKLPKVKTREWTKKEAKRDEVIRIAQDSRLGVYTEELREKR
jgi:hypothetical protein